MIFDLAKKITVAFTDDDEDDFFIYREAVQSISGNVELLHFQDCDSLFTYLEHNIPNLLLLDMHLGGVDGLECIKILRSRQHLNNMPIVIQSTSISKNLADECLAAGANYYMTKPKNFLLLQQEIRKLLSKEW